MLFPYQWDLSIMEYSNILGMVTQEANHNARVKASCDTITTSQDVGILQRLVSSTVTDF
jgi:hypothetical protein